MHVHSSHLTLHNASSARMQATPLILTSARPTTAGCSAQWSGMPRAQLKGLEMDVRGLERPISLGFWRSLCCLQAGSLLCLQSLLLAWCLPGCTHAHLATHVHASAHPCMHACTLACSACTHTLLSPHAGLHTLSAGWTLFVHTLLDAHIYHPLFVATDTITDLNKGVLHGVAEACSPFRTNAVAVKGYIDIDHPFILVYNTTVFSSVREACLH
jgi:hypothetical protein